MLLLWSQKTLPFSVSQSNFAREVLLVPESYLPSFPFAGKALLLLALFLNTVFIMKNLLISAIAAVPLVGVVSRSSRLLHQKQTRRCFMLPE
jgi:hypothetical protein